MLMRLGDEDPSSHFEDRTGSPGFGFGGGGGGNMLGCLLPFVLSRFGLGGIVILVLGYFLLTSIGGGGGLLTGGGGGGSPQVQSGRSTLDPAIRDVVLRVLGSTERRWTDVFAAHGQQYVPATMVFYRGGTQTACGAGQAAMGPFYCPNDQRIYLDTSFFDELARRFGAPGDFAMAYVIAHEVGHHVQNLTGSLEQATRAQRSAGETAGNRIQVGVELQADCYAGVWAARDQNLLEPGDVEEGMRAAEAIGDDTLQRQTQGVVVPESFTHGTSAQRMAALRAGLESGDPSRCEFSGS
jgi:predicted metalloprotease